MNKKVMRAGVQFILTVAMACSAAGVSAQSWPDRPVRIIVPYSAGGTTDFAARLIAQKLTEQTGVSFFVENKTGAGGTIGTAQVAQAAPDGSTFLTNDTAYAMLPALYAKLPWNHEKDLIPVTTLIQTPVVLVVPSASPFKTMRDLIDYAKKNPGKLNFGSGGTGSSTHLQAELFDKEAGISAVHIPYKGAGEAMLSLLANQVDFLITASPTAIPQLDGGRARALAVTGDHPISVLKGVPTFAQAGLPSYKVMNWFGFAAPKGTDPKIIDKMYREVKKALSDPALLRRLASQGAQPGGLAPSEFAAQIRQETKLWTSAAQAAGIEPK